MGFSCWDYCCEGCCLHAAAFPHTMHGTMHGTDIFTYIYHINHYLGKKNLFHHYPYQPWDRYIYLHEWLIFYGFHVGKYAVRPMDFLWVDSTLFLNFPEVERLASEQFAFIGKAKKVFQKHHFSGELLMDYMLNFVGVTTYLFVSVISYHLNICTSI